MRQVKRYSRCGGMFGLYFICFCLISWGLGYAALGLLGKTAAAQNIKISNGYYPRRWQRDHRNKMANRLHYDISYSFLADGKKYNGFSTVTSAPRFFKTVYYYSFLPYVSVICDKNGPPLSPLVLACIGFFLLYITLHSKEPADTDEIGEAEDESEGDNEGENYQNNRLVKSRTSDKINYSRKNTNAGINRASHRQSGSSWQCECGRLNAKNFCTKCGKPRPQ